jgi:cbb3-type cytochrome oxidase maturation protein
LLIPIGLVILVLSIKLLFWAINNGQYDDLDMEAHRILFDDDTAPVLKKPLMTDKLSSDKLSAQERSKSSAERISEGDDSELLNEEKSATSHK